MRLAYRIEEFGIVLYIGEFGHRPEIPRQVARFAREFGTWLKRTRRVAAENLAEYWQEESRDLPSRTEADEFLQGVDQVREAADRLEARINRLQRVRSQG